MLINDWYIYQWSRAEIWTRYANSLTQTNQDNGSIFRRPYLFGAVLALPPAKPRAGVRYPRLEMGIPSAFETKGKFLYYY